MIRGMEDQPRPDESDHVAAGRDRERRGFHRMAQLITIWAGSGAAAVEVVLAMLVWVGLGVVTRFPRWWEVGATVGLSFVTLLMLILIQHTQNHDDQAMQLKLDELIRASGAANQMMRLEEASPEDLDEIQRAFNEEIPGY